MLRDDGISQGFTVGALAIIIYLSTFIGFLDRLLIPFALLIGGLVLQRYIKGKIKHDVRIDQEEGKSILFYTIVALAIIGLGSLTIPYLFKPPVLPIQLATFDAMLYGSLFAISEERFFRGFFTPFLYSKFNFALLANFASGGAFALYHLAVYGSSGNSLMYVLIAGTGLSWVTLQSRRISPAILGHLINNMLAI